MVNVCIEVYLLFLLFCTWNNSNPKKLPTLLVGSLQTYGVFQLPLKEGRDLELGHTWLSFIK